MLSRSKDIFARSKYNPITILTALAISLFISSCIAANTHAAGTANVKTDFGAVGDGIADDTDAIQAAFDSDYSEIIFPEGEYHFTKQLTFATGDKTITGEKATLFTDDDYSTSQAAHDDAISIDRTNNIIFRGLRFEARQNENNALFKTLVTVRYANNIHFYNCDFSTAPDLADPTMNGVDFWTGWHNVSIKNSSFNMLADNNLANLSGESGSAVAFRDIQGVGASDGQFINNTVYKYGKDEIFYITQNQPTGTIENVTVSGNRFYMGDYVLSKNAFTVNLSANAPAQLKNIQVFNNEIIGQGTGHLLEIEGSENVDIFNNDLYVKVNENDASSAYGAVVGSDHFATAPNTPGTVRIRNNRTIALDSATDILSLTTGTNPFHFTDNNHIVINAPNTGYLVNHSGNFSNNNIVVNGNIHVSNNGGAILNGINKDITNNEILVNGFADIFFKQFTGNLVRPVVITGNTIATKKRANFTMAMLRAWDFNMNNLPITISNNTITNGFEVEDDKSLAAFTVESTGSNTATDRTPVEPYAYLWTIRPRDIATTTQTMQFCNNTTRGFHAKEDPSWPSNYKKIDLTCPTN